MSKIKKMTISGIITGAIIFGTIFLPKPIQPDDSVIICVWSHNACGFTIGGKIFVINGDRYDTNFDEESSE